MRSLISSTRRTARLWARSSRTSRDSRCIATTRTRPYPRHPLHRPVHRQVAAAARGPPHARARRAPGAGRQGTAPRRLLAGHAGRPPLYRYRGDTNPGDINGHGLGGEWYAVTPSGLKAPSAPGDTTN
ncbi:COG4315 family predicted lipoprotein [Thermocatellispora tengchongensis]|uniref:hypothetical protein n=1 Tax=Thermocatellispora tengchongensis TaxID=1073253 RepID=UPI0036434E17